MREQTEIDLAAAGRQNKTKTRLVCIYDNAAGKIALDYFVYFLQVIFSVLVLSNILSLFVRVNPVQARLKFRCVLLLQQGLR